MELVPAPCLGKDGSRHPGYGLRRRERQPRLIVLRGEVEIAGIRRGQGRDDVTAVLILGRFESKPRDAGRLFVPAELKRVQAPESDRRMNPDFDPVAFDAVQIDRDRAGFTQEWPRAGNVVLSHPAPAATDLEVQHEELFARVPLQELLPVGIAAVDRASGCRLADVRDRGKLVRKSRKAA